MPKHEESPWTTEISCIAPDEIRMRGYRIDELMGRVGYAGAVYLLIVGEIPSPGAERVLDAILVSSADHGATPPSTLAARTAASTGAPLNAALAAGILSINEFHGGAIERCMGHLAEVAAAETGAGSGAPAGDSSERGHRPSAAALVSRSLETKQRLSGFGHRVHHRDPRVARLFALAEEVGLAGEWVARARVLETALVEASGKPLYLNVDGAIAALLWELEIPAEVSNALFMVARLPGLIAHVVEERRTELPMRRIVPGSERYVGPGPRDLPGKER
ncbi:MAG: citryl-CoA lyase [bacterium]